MSTPYRASARRAPSQAPLRIYAETARARAVLWVLALAGIVFVAFVTPLAAERSHLRCERTPSMQIQCTHERHFGPGIERDVSLGELTRARVTRTRSSGGINTTLVFEGADGAKTAVMGVGPSGVRAATVAADVNAFLANPMRTQGRWLLREGSLLATLIVLGLGAAFAVGVLLAHRSTVISLHPRERLVIVRDSFRRRASSWRAAPLDHITGAVAVPATAPQGAVFTVRIVCEPASESIDLPMRIQSWEAATADAAQLQARIERWQRDDAA